MPELIEKIVTIGNKAVRLAQEDNRRKGVANVYCLNGALVWQMPDGTITTKEPISHRIAVREKSFRSAIGCARKYFPNFTSTDDLMRELREGEE